MSLKGKPDCPDCGGRGVILDPDPMKPARICACTSTADSDGASLGIPARYRNAGFDDFWEWWKGQHPKEKLAELLASAHQIMEQADARDTLHSELRSMLDLVLHKCGVKMQADRGITWKDLKPAQEPHGYRALINWTKHDREHVDLWWIDGNPGSGRSTLAAASLKAWSERSGKSGLFISVRTFSQELKDIYYDSRSFHNQDFLSERDRMTPLLATPCLVLDDLDRMDSDIRVVRAIAQLLDHRYSSELPTIITASRWAGSLQATSPEHYPFLRLEDPSLLNRLTLSKRVALRPTLERLMESVNG